MKRREFIKLLGGTVAGWPLAARAQQATRMRRVGALMNIAENDPQSLVWASAFERGLQERGWTPGANLQIDYRWANDENLYRRFAHELIALTPEVVLAVSGSSATSLEVTGTIPSYSWEPAIRSTAGSLPVWNSPAATSRDLSSSNPASVGSGCSCSNRLRRA